MDRYDKIEILKDYIRDLDEKADYDLELQFSTNYRKASQLICDIANMDEPALDDLIEMFGVITEDGDGD